MSLDAKLSAHNPKNCISVSRGGDSVNIPTAYDYGVFKKNKTVVFSLYFTVLDCSTCRGRTGLPVLERRE